MNRDSPEPQDLDKDIRNRISSNPAVRIAGNLGKHAARKGLNAAKKVITVIIKSSLKALIAFIGPPALFLGFVTIVLFVMFIGIYGGMTQESMLTDADVQKQDREVKNFAINRADSSNIFETWEVPGEGSWHQTRVEHENKADLFQKFKVTYHPTDQDETAAQSYSSESNYQGEGMALNGWKYLGGMSDNEGKDQKIKNQWGDVYTPVLFNALRFSSDNLMSKAEYISDGFNESGFELKPYFYYKASKITVTSADDNGDTSSSSSTVYLLVEAYTIRGHMQYHYETISETSGKTTITREVLKDVIVMDDGRKYLAGYLVKLLEIDLEETESTTDAVFEAMQGFTAQKEWLGWLLNEKSDSNNLLSAAAIPSEYANMLKEASDLSGIPTHILAAIILKESTWNSMAVNGSTGCFGLTQLNPDYWTERAQRYGFDPEKDQWNPRAQIVIGALVVRDLIGEDNLPDWNGRNWDEDSHFRSAMASYGGYGSNVDEAAGYIDDIVAKARVYIAPAVFPAVGYGFGNITSGYGIRNGEFHGGIDIGCPSGTAIVSASAGVVTQVGYSDPIYGNYIIISDLSYMYLYGHLSEIAVSKGQEIHPGMEIGRSGDTGRSSGPHLHFGISVIGGNPKNYNSAVDPRSIIPVQ